MLQRYLALFFGVVVTSCYIFPFVLSAFPLANSKMIMAAIGIGLYAIGIFQDRGNTNVGKAFLQLTLWALAVSFISWIATVVNNTHDYTFASYIVSMWVWIGGGFTAVSYIKRVHGNISVQLLANYLLAVCVMQCVLALIFDYSEAAFDWRVRTFTGEAYMGATDDDRLTGIGCALDVAGLRFSAILIMAGFLAVRATRRGDHTSMLIYLAAIVFVTVIGNMISRTTIVGAAIAIAYIVAGSIMLQHRHGNFRLTVTLSSFTVLAVMLSAFLYNRNESFRDNLRFGFEGFFSLVETGKWETHSNNILKSMVVWPDNTKTWLIGDGYINNPLDKNLVTYDPYYVGPSYGGYYKQTDIGYCRYIFYFGIVGLTVFCLYFITVSNILARRFPSFKWMFYLVLLMNFIGWCKVSSDLFMVFAPFLCISTGEQKEYEQKETLLER